MIPETINKSQFLFFLTFLLLIIPIIVQAQSIIYVDSAATGNNDGTSWEHAYINPQYALDEATSGDSIWVAQGTYYPDTTDNDRSSTFQLVFGVSLYGGFAGTESSLKERKIANYETILSGDLQQNDPTTSDNAYHIVTGEFATIDGFTITAGNANGSVADSVGGGMYNDGRNPKLYNCTFKTNSAKYGGGMGNVTSSGPLLVNCIFLNNSASQDGGGIYNEGGSDPELYNCSFSNNTAGNFGNGMYNGIGCTSKLVNCILWGSETTSQIRNGNNVNLSVTYSDIQGSGMDGYNDIEGGGPEDDSLNIDIDPLFRNDNSNLLLQSGSPCLGTGSPDTLRKIVPDIPNTDKDDRSRPLPETATYLDMGAYEQYDDGSLPVELFLFSATYENGYVLLSWRTESEVDHQGFILERKEEGSTYQHIASYETHPELRGEDNTSSSTEYEFMDEKVYPGTTYFYRLSDVSTQGHITTYPAISITLEELPEKIELDNAYPNPFNPQTFIGYHLSERTQIKLTVVDILGRKVKKLFYDEHSAGNYHIYWNGKDDSGNKCPSGVYIIQLQTTGITKAKKVMLLK